MVLPPLYHPCYLSHFPVQPTCMRYLWNTVKWTSMGMQLQLFIYCNKLFRKNQYVPLSTQQICTEYSILRGYIDVFERTSYVTTTRLFDIYSFIILQLISAERPGCWRATKTELQNTTVTVIYQVPHFLDFFPRVLLISVPARTRVQFKSGNKGGKFLPIIPQGPFQGVIKRVDYFLQG